MGGRSARKMIPHARALRAKGGGCPMDWGTKLSAPIPRNFLNFPVFSSQIQRRFSSKSTREKLSVAF